MIKTFKIIGVVVMVYITVFSCNKLISRKLEKDIEKSPAIEIITAKNEIKQVATIMNSRLPKRIDEITTATKAEYLEKENKFVLYYEVKGLKKKDKSEEQIGNIIRNLKTEQLNYINNNPNNKTFNKAKVTFEYIYNDINDDLFCSFKITPEEFIN